MSHTYQDGLLVKGGLVVDPEGVFRADIKIVGGKIVALGRDISPEGISDIIEASGLLIFPGIVDEHVHMREPGLEYKDNFTHGTMAAAVGGVTTVIEQPNTLPPVDEPQKLVSKAELLKSKAYVDFALYGVLHDSNTHMIEDLVSVGAVGFKVFLGPTTGNIPPPSEGSLYEILNKSSKLGVTVAFHAEDHQLINYFTNKVKSSGRVDPQAHEDARPPIAEELAITKLILMSKRTGGRVHILHMSSKEGVELLKEALMEGINVTGETCPHYLTFSSDDYQKYGTLIKVNPPIRSNTHRESLLRAVNEGIISALGSDHAPHTKEEKLKPVWDAAAGFPNVQTFFPVILDMALRGLIPLTRIPKLASENPAKYFGLWPRKGAIRIGSDGDLVIVDPNGKTLVTEEWLHYKHKVTPYLGWELRGKVKYVLLRGNVIVKDSRLVITEPKGIWLKKNT
ncbi:MAG: allantoinase AllB [Desulfurococcaceae archaeon TW002]